MSNTWLNIRFGVRHLQVIDLRDWLAALRSGRSPVTFRVNPYQQAVRVNEPERWRWFEVMEVRLPW